MKHIKKIIVPVLFFFISISQVHGYIGPGAGFAFLTSFLVLFLTFFLALFSIFSWPFRFILRAIRGRRAYTKGKINQVVIIGLDGLDPRLTEKFMAEGKLPNFSKLKKEGTFSQLKTTTPAISPVAWSSFITGVNPAKHNIFDFLSRDPKTYLPDLSSARIGKAKRTISIRRYSIPVGKPEIKLLRKSKPFWKLLGEKGIFSTVLRVPITFPPEKFNGVLLSGMCVPDLKGSQGTFSFYTTDTEKAKKHTGGTSFPITKQGNKIKGCLYGPENTLLKKQEELCLPFVIHLKDGSEEALLEISEEKVKLKKGQYSDWIRVTFKPGLGIKVRGTCRFLITQISPYFEMYVTPINIDPEKPALPISHPFIYSIYLAKLLGSYITLGLANDTWALNEAVIDDQAFLTQCYLNHQDWEEILFNALNKIKKGLCVCVFETTDSIQHMFWRYLEDNHPALRNEHREDKYKQEIENLYRRMDDLIGRVMEKLNKKGMLIVMSDHGFTSFRRGINLNSWFYLNGYLSLKQGREKSDEWFKDVDWGKTRAYALGLGGLYINQKGREAKGIVNPEQEKDKLKEELIAKLTGLRDEEKGKIGIKKVYDTQAIYSGPYLENAPDLIIGYNEGYRASWESVTGKVNKIVFEDNIKKWSGDHCLDPGVVPGVFFCSQKIKNKNPRIIDIAPTVLKLFGLDIPSYIDGESLIE
ncbi:MAG: alkaline phosphatase family protein [Candidatus Aminicenantia bacterium]